MKRLITFLILVLLLPAASYAVILGEAPLNKTVAYRSLYTCTDGEWKKVRTQRYTRSHTTETAIGYKCVYKKRRPKLKKKTD